MQGNFPVWLWPILKQARFGDLGRTAKEEKEEKQRFINYYRCRYDGAEWIDVWSCCCNDMCPKCETKDIEPYRSEEIIHTKPRKRKQVERGTKKDRG